MWRTVIGRIRTALSTALVAATLLSAWALVVALAQGGLVVRQRGHAADVLVVVAAYYAAALAGGLLVGALQPLARWRAGSVFLATLTSAVAFVGLHYAQVPAPAWGRFEYTKLAVLSVLFGVLLGLILPPRLAAARRARGAEVSLPQPPGAHRPTRR